MCRGKVDQWTGAKDNTGALVSTTGHLWLVGIIVLLSYSPVCVSNLQNDNSKLNNMKIHAANAMNHSFLNIMLNDCIHALHNLLQHNLEASVRTVE